MDHAHRKGGDKSSAHVFPDGRRIPDNLAAALKEAAVDDRLPCAACFAVAEKARATPAETGAAMDALGIAITRCQLGLFGYHPDKKIVQPAPEVSADLAQAIDEHLENARLPCQAAWDIADARAMARMDVAAACESLDIRIKPCQLGAF